MIAALLAGTARGNITVAAADTLITNPLTIRQIYYEAYRIDVDFLGPMLDAPAETDGGLASAVRMFEIAARASFPTAVRLMVLAALVASTGHGLVHLAWRFPLQRQWRRRERPPRLAEGNQDRAN